MRQEIRQAAIRGCRRRAPLLMAGLAVIFMVIMAAAPAPLQAASQVAEILLSDHADANGVVEKHQSTFPRSVGEIHGTALIAGVSTRERNYHTTLLCEAAPGSPVRHQRFDRQRRGHLHFRLPQTLQRLAAG